MKKRNKPQPRFAVVRRGYDIASVEAYIALEREKADKAGLEQKERIRVLKAQCDRLVEELEVYRDKEEQIKAALIAAGEQAEKTELDIKLRYAMELERLKLFRAKWTGAYEELKERYGFGKDALNMESVAVSVRMELERFLAKDFALDRGGAAPEQEEQFKAEAERLSEEDDKVRELRDKLVKAAERKDREAKLDSEKKPRTSSAAADVPVQAFSLEEAVHPTAISRIALSEPLSWCSRTSVYAPLPDSGSFAHFIEISPSGNAHLFGAS